MKGDPNEAAGVKGGEAAAVPGEEFRPFPPTSPLEFDLGGFDFQMYTDKVSSFGQCVGRLIGGAGGSAVVGDYTARQPHQKVIP